MCTRIRMCAISGRLRFMVLVRRNGCWIITAGDLDVGFLMDFLYYSFSLKAGDDQQFGGLASRESSVPTRGFHPNLFLARLWFGYRR